MSLGKRLRDLRVAKGLTQTELAEPYYTYSYISAIESGRRHPSEDALAHFAAKLGADAEEIKTGRPRSLESEVELRLAEIRRQISQGKLRGAEDALDEVAKLVKKFKVIHLQARVLTMHALLRERQDKSSHALALYQEARELLRGQPPTLLVDPIAGEARCLQMAGDARYAIHVLETTIRTLEEARLDEPGAMLRLHASLIGAYFQAGLYDRAYASAEEALRLAPNVHEPERVANMYLNAAWALNHRGNPKEAHEMLLRAEHLFEEMELKLELGRARLARGMTLSRQGKPAAARKELERATAVFEQTESPLDTARCLNELGRIQRIAGRVEEAVASLENACFILKKEEHPAVLGWAHRELGLTLVESDAKSAEKHFARAIELYQRADEPIELAETYRCVGDLADARGDDKGAQAAYREGIVQVAKRT